MAKKPKIFIITLNWNGIDDTSSCLESLRKLDYDNFRTIVVDNGSENKEAEKLKKKFPETTVLPLPVNMGFTGGNNAGIDLALKQKADYVLLLNNDTVVTKDFLDKMVDFYEIEPRAGAVSPRILYLDKKTIWFDGAKLVIWLGISRNMHKGQKVGSASLPTEPFRTGYNSGAALLMSTKLLKQVGKLNDRYFIYYEDLEWCYKAAKLGQFPYVVPKAVIYHKKSASTGEGGKSRFSKRPAYMIARNAVYFSTNLKGFDKFLYLAAQVWFKLPVSLFLLVAPSAWLDYTAGLVRGFYEVARGRVK